MRILITNDDGIYSPGIAALAKIALKFGSVTITAPDVEQSSMGHAVTHSRPLTCKKSLVKFEGIEAFRVNGTPADCVAIGTHLHQTDLVLSGINLGMNLGNSMGHAVTHSRPLTCKKSLVKFEGIEAFRVNGTPADCVAIGTHLHQTDLVLSGINLGMNLGNSMWHSGTLAAAKQAVLLGIKGIAISSVAKDASSDYQLLEPFIEQVLQTLISNAPFGLYNVNLPSSKEQTSEIQQRFGFSY